MDSLSTGTPQSQSVSIARLSWCILILRRGMSEKTKGKRTGRTRSRPSTARTRDRRANTSGEETYGAPRVARVPVFDTVLHTPTRDGDLVVDHGEPVGFGVYATCP